MKFKDFIYEFSSYAVCYISNWNEVRIRGKFVLLKEEINIISKWYYYIKLEKKNKYNYKFIPRRRNKEKFIRYSFNNINTR